jgi:hypothetical protein
MKFNFIFKIGQYQDLHIVVSLTVIGRRNRGREDWAKWLARFPKVGIILTTVSRG